MDEKLMDYYQVAWSPVVGVTRYGVSQHDEAAFKKGFLVVSDAVLPVADRVAITKARKVEFEFDGEYDRYVNAAFEKASKLSKSLKGLQAGKLFSIAVADGRAWYVVTKVTPRNVTVEWRGFCADRYTDQILGWGGSFPRRTIEPLVKRNDALDEIFGRKEKS